MPSPNLPKFKKLKLIRRNGRTYLPISKELLKKLKPKNQEINFVMTNSVMQVSGEQPNVAIPMANITAESFLSLEQ